MQQYFLPRKLASAKVIRASKQTIHLYRFYDRRVKLFSKMDRRNKRGGVRTVSWFAAKGASGIWNVGNSRHRVRNGCHAGIVDENGKIIDPAKHINGKIDYEMTERNF